MTLNKSGVFVIRELLGQATFGIVSFSQLFVLGSILS